jgi:hypothetical protein
MGNTIVKPPTSPRPQTEAAHPTGVAQGEVGVSMPSAATRRHSTLQPRSSASGPQRQEGRAQTPAGERASDDASAVDPGARRRGPRLGFADVATGALLTAGYIYRDRIADVAAPALERMQFGPNDPRVRASTDSSNDHVPDCEDGCLASFVKDGGHAEGVSDLIDGSMARFKADNEGFVDAGAEAQVRARSESPVPVLGMSSVGTHRINLNPKEIDASSKLVVGDAGPDAALELTAYHELVHAYSSRAFLHKALALGAEIQKQVGTVGPGADARPMLLEALTVALEHPPAGVASGSYNDRYTLLAADPTGFPLTWQALGFHLKEHLGEETIKKAVFNGDAEALKSLSDYVHELLAQRPPKRVEVAVPSA